MKIRFVGAGVSVPILVGMFLLFTSTAFALPDLTFTSAPPNVVPSPVIPGDPVSSSGYTVKNVGTTATGPWQVAFYLSTDSVITPADVFIGYPVVATTPLAPGESYTVTAATWTQPIPPSTPPGTYYIGIYADWQQAMAESNENNNYVSTQVTVGSSTYELSVTVTGSGTVTSSPAGINCTHGSISGSATCTANFAGGTNVTLHAAPVDGSEYTSYFQDWSGDCSGTSTNCGVTVNGDKTVTAAFAALGIPIAGLAVPDGQDLWNYLPVTVPVTGSAPSDCKPFVPGDPSTGMLSLRVGLPPFIGSVDIYLALYNEGLGPEIWLITAGNMVQPLSDGFAPWKAGTTGGFDETIFGDIPLAWLPSGTYYLLTLVMPAGDASFNLYYAWTSYFMNM